MAGELMVNTPSCGMEVRIAGDGGDPNSDALTIPLMDAILHQLIWIIWHKHSIHYLTGFCLSHLGPLFCPSTVAMRWRGSKSATWSSCLRASCKQIK